MFSRQSTVKRVGGSSEDPDYLYYNVSIINNNANDLAGGVAVKDPAITFNETRDTYLIKNSSDYFFSIVRFSMAGPGLDLPLFIPDIQTGTGQTNVNLTSYGLATTYKQTWAINTAGGLQSKEFIVTPPISFLIWDPENKNTVIAPLPRSVASPSFVGLYDVADTYVPGQIVTLAVTVPYNTGTAPYYVCNVANGPLNLQTPGSGSTVTNPLDPNFGKPYWLQTSANLGATQDISTYYYHSSTYEHVVGLVNKTVYDPSQSSLPAPFTPTSAVAEVYNAFYDQWITYAPFADPTGAQFPYATLGDFAETIIPPKVKYDTVTGLFSIIADSDAYGERIQTFVAVAPPAFPGLGTPQNAPVCRLFMNTNMFGLFANFPNTYYNSLVIPGLGVNQPNFPGYTNEILFPNKDYTNILDYRQLPYSAVTPLFLQKPYWVTTQEAISTDSLWSPIQALVFTSTLLPIQNESGGPPIDLGSGNLGFSSPTVRSAFEPIITDVILPLGDKGAIDYRGFIYYSPTAEYRLSDFTANTEIRNIDIQIYWRSRLDNTLYPVPLYNQSNVSLKFMFRKKSAHSQSGAQKEAGYE
jgi:hypothetical protein